MSTGKTVAAALALAMAAKLFAACTSTSIDNSSTDALDPVTATTAPGTTSSAPGSTSTSEQSDDSSVGDAEQAAADGDGGETGDLGLSYVADVMPVLERNCVSCHSASGPGTAHVRLETAAQVASLAEFIATEIEDRRMPPWRLSGLEEVAYRYRPAITDDDRQLIVDWATQGAPLDVADDTPLIARTETHRAVNPDVVLRPQTAYPGSTRLDDYRCQIVDPDVDDTTWIKAIEVLPDQEANLHHGIVFKLFSDVRSRAEQLDGQDGKPGWSCPTVPLLAIPLPQLAGWAPGTGPIVLPEGVGIEMEPGDAFVVQWHYHYDSGPVEDNSGLALELVSPQLLAENGGRLESLRSLQLFGPVEIPCSDTESGPLCDRDRALERVRDEFGEQAAGIPGFVNRICGVSPATYADMTDGNVTSSCDLPAPNGQVVSVWPHMHELGAAYRLTLNPGTAGEKVLIDIDRWDFQWQTGYYPDELLTLANGDTLRMECTWDRSLWPEDVESRYVVWAEGTHDEMCYTSLSYRKN